MRGKNCLFAGTMGQQVIHWLRANGIWLCMENIAVWVCVCMCRLNTPVSGTDTRAWRRWSIPLLCCRAAWSKNRCIGNSHQQMTAADPSGQMTWGWSLFLGRGKRSMLINIQKMKSSSLVQHQKKKIRSRSLETCKELGALTYICTCLYKGFLFPFFPHFPATVASLQLSWHLHSWNDGGSS